MLLLRLCSVLALATNTVAKHEFRLANTESETRLPKAMSDMSGVVGPDGLIYIAGGCDSVFGSQYNEETGTFNCNSVSSSFYSFDPETEEFNILPAMPEVRYRHAAVAVNNQIWVVGGRDENDELVGIINVYDLGDMRWRRFRDLHESYWLSDLGGFSANGLAYFVGGFTDEYRAVRKVWSINPESSWSSGTLDIVRHANLANRRGDVGVTVDGGERFAYVSGGSSHVNNFCSPLNSVEVYDLYDNYWEEVAPLQQGRTGKSVIQINNQLVALGGAQQVSKLCNKTTGDPSDMQTPVYEVEIYDDEEWVVVDSLADYRFRSTSVVSGDTVYSFGGQSVYFSVCMCHPTVDAVVTYQVELPMLEAGGLVNGNTFDLNFQNPGAQSQEEEPQDNEYNDAPQYYVSPGSDLYSDSTPLQDAYQEPEAIQPKGNFGEDEEDPYASGDDFDDSGEKNKDSEATTDYGTTQSGFGGYHRDKDGLLSPGSSSFQLSTRFLYTATVGVIAAIVL